MPMPMSGAKDLEQVKTNLLHSIGFIHSIVYKPNNKQSEKCLFLISDLMYRGLEEIDIRINEVWKDAEVTTGKIHGEYGRENARDS